MKEEKEKVGTKAGYWLLHQIIQTANVANTPTSRLYHFPGEVLDQRIKSWSVSEQLLCFAYGANIQSCRVLFSFSFFYTSSQILALLSTKTSSTSLGPCYLRILYYDLLLAGLFMLIIRSIAVIQNAAAQLVSDLCNSSHITPVLCSLHLVPLVFKKITCLQSQT